MFRKINAYLQTKWPTITWSAIVFVLLAVPIKPLREKKMLQVPEMDKLVHAFLFFVLVWLWAKYISQGKKLASATLLYIAAAATFYGISMEYIQLFTGRDFSMGDMVADGAGAFLAAVFFWAKNKPR